MVTVKLRTPMSLLLGRDGILDIQEGELFRITNVLSPDGIPQACIEFCGEFEVAHVLVDPENEFEDTMIVSLESNLFGYVFQIGCGDDL